MLWSVKKIYIWFFFCLQPWARHYRWSVTFAITIGLSFFFVLSSSDSESRKSTRAISLLLYRYLYLFLCLLPCTVAAAAWQTTVPTSFNRCTSRPWQPSRTYITLSITSIFSKFWPAVLVSHWCLGLSNSLSTPSVRSRYIIAVRGGGNYWGRLSTMSTTGGRLTCFRRRMFVGMTIIL